MIASRIRNPDARRALMISLTYAAAAAAWIVVTEWGLELLLHPAQSLAWSTGKGLLFVAISTLVLYLSLRTQTWARRPLEDRARQQRPDSSGSSVSNELDVTRRKHIEEQLRKLSLAVEHSPVSVVITDREGSIEYVNPKFTELTGYTFEETRGQNPRILKSGHTSAEVYGQMWASIKSGQSWQGEFHKAAGKK